MKAAGPFGKVEGLQVGGGGGAACAGSARVAAKREKREKAAREKVEPSWGVIAEPLSKNGAIC